MENGWVTSSEEKVLVPVMQSASTCLKQSSQYEGD